MEAITMRISQLSLTEMIEDEIVLQSCSDKGREIVIPGSEPLNPNDFLEGTEAAVHAGDQWLSIAISSCAHGISDAIDSIVEEYLDRVEYMIAVLKGGD